MHTSLLLLARLFGSLTAGHTHKTFCRAHTAAHKAHTAAHMLSLPLTSVQDATAADANAAADAQAAAAAANAPANAAERTPFHGQAHNSWATFPPSRGFPESPTVAVHHRAAPNALNAHNALNGAHNALYGALNALYAQNAHNGALNAHNADDLCEDMAQQLVEDMVQHSVEGKAEKHLAKDFVMQVPARSDSPALHNNDETVRNCVGVRPAHPATHAPLRQKDASGNSDELSGGITREHVKYMVHKPVEDMDKQPAKDFVTQVPAHLDSPGRKCACKVVRNNVGVRSAHSAASARAPLCRKDIMASKSGGITRELAEDIVLDSVKDMVFFSYLTESTARLGSQR